ncbi:MAG: hypothetical protein JNK05_07445 [Myxococcales bacterium]|nr:hypothetical protein [Myxococcales bacterium]
MMRSKLVPCVALASASALVSSAALAQTAPQQSTVQVTPNQALPCPPAADTLFNSGIERMSAGDDAGAAVLFGRVLELCPTHPSAAEMRRNAEQHARGTQVSPVQVTGATGTVQGQTTPQSPVQVTTPPAGAGATSPTQVANNGWPTNNNGGGWSGWNAPPNYNLVYGPDPVTLGSRLNLVISQGVVGMAVGAWVPLIVTSSPRPEHIAGGVLLGGAVGITGSLLASMGGVTNGQAIAVNMGSVLGLGLGSSIAMLAASTPQTTFGLLAGGLALGTAAGAIVATQRPLSGRMLYFSSTALWGAMVATHGYFGVAGGSTSLQGVGGFLLGGLLVAGGVGAVSAPFVNVSADRMAWINLSMFGGWTVIGLSSLLFASNSGGSAPLVAYSWGSIAGAALGAVFGILMTRETDRYWHDARAQQQQGAQTPATQTPPGAQSALRRRPRESLPFTIAPGGSTDSPLGLTVAGAF